MNNDLLDIAARFGNRIQGFNEMFLNKIKNDQQMRLKNADDAIFVMNVKTLIWKSNMEKEDKNK